MLRIRYDERFVSDTASGSHLCSKKLLAREWRSAYSRTLCRSILQWPAAWLQHAPAYPPCPNARNGSGGSGSALEYYPGRPDAKTKAEAVDITKLQKG